ncbi:MAG: ADP-ribosylglycohydrolase family protein, partial [Candidatus Latescibacteria bacterium]|nr:ADP-ribosylglycohydrolase family protein [Candidatus Latescibacterota bacterium]
MAEVDQFVGCLVGTCVGDALGYVIEGQTPEQCDTYIKKRIRGGDLEGWTGQYSDDSQFTRELMQSLVACGTFDPTDYARRICALFVEDRIIGPGMGAIAAARLLAEDVPWYDAGTPAPSAGNGTAMRVAPLGVFYARDHAVLLKSARDQALITHLDPRCIAGAVAIAGAAALTSEDPTGDPVTFVPLLEEWCRDDDPILSDALTHLPEWRSMPPEWVRGAVKKIGDVP